MHDLYFIFITTFFGIIYVIKLQNPEYLHELGCEWNYRLFQCSFKENKCPITDTNGANIIHGNALAFINKAEMKFRV